MPVRLLDRCVDSAHNERKIYFQAQTLLHIEREGSMMKKMWVTVLSLLLLLNLWPAAALMEAKAPVTINVFYTSNCVMNEHTDKVRQWAIENLGVDINLTLGSTEWKQQLALYITSGDIPDMVGYMDYQTFRTYAEEGVFLDLTDYLDEYTNIAPYVADQTAAPEAVWQRLSVDGRIYGIPYMSGAPTKYVNVIRKDWLDKLGLEMPTTLEELTEVMRAFAKNDPDGNGVNDTYGYDAQNFLHLTSFFGAFGATTQEDYFLGEDGKIVTNVISQSYRNALAYVRDLYAEGLIDPEVFTNSMDQVFEKWVRGNFGVWTSWWTFPGNAYSRYGFGEANPDAEVAYLPPFTGPDGLSGHLAADDISSVVGLSYNASPEVIDACMRVLDFQATGLGYRVFMYGIEGVHFEMDHEKDLTTWTFGMEGKDKLGNAITDMEVYKILGNNPIQYQTYYLDAESLSQQMYAGAVGAINESPILSNLFIGLTTEETKVFAAELTKYMTEMSIKFITGDASLDSDWDTYVSTYLKMGGDTVRQSLLKMYNGMNGTSYTFAD